MKRVSVLVVAALVIGLGSAGANASPQVFDKKFTNCSALNKVYRGGVAESAKWVNNGGEIKNKQTVRIR